MGNFTSMLYNEEGYTERSYCRRKVRLFLHSADCTILFKKALSMKLRENFLYLVKQKEPRFPYFSFEVIFIS